MINDRVNHDESLNEAWAVIEAKRALPVTIAVVGATERDDTAAVARGLARSAVFAGRRSAYLSLTGVAAHGEYDVLILPQASVAGYYERSQTWRLQYDVLIIDVRGAQSSAVGGQVMRSADGVVVALCGDRQIAEPDRRLSTFLEQLGASTLGVVQTRPAKSVQEAPALRFTFAKMGRTLRALVFRT